MAASITLKAAMVFPGFQREIRAAAENERLLSSAVAEIHQEDPQSGLDSDDLKSLLIQLSDGKEPLCCSVAVFCYLYVEAAHWVSTAMNVAEAVNAAVWFNVAMWTNRWVWNGKKQKRPKEQISGSFDGGSLSSEMLINYLAEKWARPVPVEM